MKLPAKQRSSNVQNLRQPDFKPFHPYDDPAFSSDPNANPDHAAINNLGHLQPEELPNQFQGKTQYHLSQLPNVVHERQKSHDVRNTYSVGSPHVDGSTSSSSSSASSNHSTTVPQPIAGPPQIASSSANKAKGIMAFLRRKKGNNKESLLPSRKTEVEAKGAVNQRDAWITSSIHVGDLHHKTVSDSGHHARTMALDMIDELDETNPLGHRLHHGGPYEAVSKFANGSARLRATPEYMPRSKAHDLMLRSPLYGVPLNVSPGQIFPTDGLIYPRTPMPQGLGDSRVFPYQTARGVPLSYKAVHVKPPPDPPQAVFVQQPRRKRQPVNTHASQHSWNGSPDQEILVPPRSNTSREHYAPTSQPSNLDHLESFISPQEEDSLRRLQHIAPVPKTEPAGPLVHSTNVESMVHRDQEYQPQGRTESDVTKILQRPVQPIDTDVSSANMSTTTRSTNASSRSHLLPHNRPRHLVMPAPLSMQTAFNAIPETPRPAPHRNIFGVQHHSIDVPRSPLPRPAIATQPAKWSKDTSMVPDLGRFRRHAEEANIMVTKLESNTAAKPVASVAFAAHVGYQEPSGVISKGKLKMGRKVLTKKRM